MASWMSAKADCLGDVDNDGVVGFSDILQILANWGNSCKGCPKGLDGRGVVGFNDLLAVLSEFGPCWFLMLYVPAGIDFGVTFTALPKA